MALKNFNEKEKEVIHYIFASLYVNSINKYSSFNGHIYSKWLSKGDNIQFFNTHYPTYASGFTPQTLTTFLQQLLTDIDGNTYNWPILNFISHIKSDEICASSCLINDSLKQFCTNYVVPSTLVIPPTQPTQVPSQSSSNTIENLQSNDDILSKIASLIDQKFKTYADAIKGLTCSSNNMDSITNEIKDLLQKERTLSNHLTVNKSYEQTQVFPKVYDRFRFPPYLFNKDADYINKYNSEIIKVKNQWLKFNIEYIQNSLECVSSDISTKIDSVKIFDQQFSDKMDVLKKEIENSSKVTLEKGMAKVQSILKNTNSVENNSINNDNNTTNIANDNNNDNYIGSDHNSNRTKKNKNNNSQKKKNDNNKSSLPNNNNNNNNNKRTGSQNSISNPNSNSNSNKNYRMNSYNDYAAPSNNHNNRYSYNHSFPGNGNQFEFNNGYGYNNKFHNHSTYSNNSASTNNSNQNTPYNNRSQNSNNFHNYNNWNRNYTY